MRKLLRRIRYTLHARRQADELREELEFHRDMTERELRADGVARSDAPTATQRRLGHDLLSREQARDVWIAPWLQGLAQDLRFVARLLYRERGFTFVCAFTLALGIGGATTMFTLLNGMLLRGLPVERPELIMGVTTFDANGRRIGGGSLPDYEDWSRAALRTAAVREGATRPAFDSFAAYHTATINIADKDRAPESFGGVFVTASLLYTLGERPILGRDFRADEDRPGAAAVAIIGHRVWANRYHSDPRIVGRVVTLNGVPTEIIGVMRAGFRHPLVHDIWLPLRQSPSLAADKRDARTLDVIARLHDDASLSRARAELGAIAARLAQDHPATNRQMQVRIEPFTGTVALGNPWVAMLGVCLFVLLIGCANVANLLLARAARRGREIAVRAALGASRWRIIRQLLVESLALAAIAGLLGWGFGAAGLAWWKAATADINWPYWFVWTMEARVIWFVAGITVMTAVLFGLAPALQLAKTNVHDVMKAGGRSGMQEPKRARWSSALLAVELALTLVLLTGAGLLARSLLAVYQADAIVDVTGVQMASIELPAVKYRTPEQRLAFHRQLAERLAAIPGVESTATASAMPFYTAQTRPFQLDSRALSAGSSSAAPSAGGLAAEALKSSYVVISPRYFDMLRLPLVAGRPFTDRDGAAGAEAAIVNQQFVSMFFGGANPIGQRIRLPNPTRGASDGASEPWLTIVGVSPTVRQHYARDIDPVVYVPYRQQPDAGAVVFVRSRTTDAAAIAAPLRAALRTLDPDLPPFDSFALAGLQAQTRFASQMFATIFSVFSAIALILSAIGLAAVTAYAVTQRTQEIGVRMALGARAPDVVWLFVRRALLPLAFGLALGVGGALAMGQLIRGMLIRTSPADPATIASLAVLLVLVALIACALPARRAARLDPTVALRPD